MSQLDVFQQVFGLSLAAHIDRYCEGTLAELQLAINKHLLHAIRLLGPGWELVWGPVVWQSDSTQKKGSGPPENTWFVARNEHVTFNDGKSYITYVVSFAGTLGGLFSWDVVDEDFGVKEVVDFFDWSYNKRMASPPQPAIKVDPISGTYVAYGTASTVYTLLTYPAPPNALAGAGKTLRQFLEGISSQPSATFSRIVFSGHSLGGALAPTFAVGAVQARILGMFQLNNMLTYPSAGPTSGNSQFVQMFSLFFPAYQSGPSTDYRVWNQNVVNSLDCVPNGWANLDAIPYIYGILDDFTTLELESVIELLKTRLPDNGVKYESLPRSVFSGPTSTPPANISKFACEALNQHTTVYVNHVGIPQIPNLCPVGTCMEKALKYPIIGDIYKLKQARIELVKAERRKAAIRRA